jgi:hypothetical protein
LNRSKIPTAGPWASRSEQLVDQALNTALSMTPDQLRKMRPIAAPQKLNPQRTGFQQRQSTINDVLNVDRRTPTYRSWVSGVITQPSVISDYTWEGSSRNAMSEGIF